MSPRLTLVFCRKCGTLSTCISSGYPLFSHCGGYTNGSKSLMTHTLIQLLVEVLSAAISALRGRGERLEVGVG